MRHPDYTVTMDRGVIVDVSLWMSPFVAGYTRNIAEVLDKQGSVTLNAVTAEEANRMRSRIFNAANRVGFVVTTHWDGHHVHGTLMGWKD